MLCLLISDLYFSCSISSETTYSNSFGVTILMYMSELSSLTPVSSLIFFTAESDISSEFVVADACVV